MAGMLQRAVNILYRLDLLEARVGIEPTNKGFADLCLTSLSPSGSSSERRFVTLRASSMTVALRRPPSPLPRLHRLPVAPQPAPPAPDPTAPSPGVRTADTTMPARREQSPGSGSAHPAGWSRRQ